MGYGENVDVPNILPIRQAVWFDVLCEHDPPGTLPGESVEKAFRIAAWINRISAYNPEEAGRKAEQFLTETRGVRNIRVMRWRFFNSRRDEKEVKPDGSLF